MMRARTRGRCLDAVAMARLVDGALTGRALRRARRHLRRCPDCADWHATVQAVVLELAARARDVAQDGTSGSDPTLTPTRGEKRA